MEAIRPFYPFCFEQNMLTLLSMKTFLSQMSHFLLSKRKLRVIVPKPVEMRNKCVMKPHKYSIIFPFWYNRYLTLITKLYSVVAHYSGVHCLQTFFLLFKCANHENKRTLCSNSHYKPLVGTLISIGDVTRNIAIVYVDFKVFAALSSTLARVTLIFSQIHIRK